MIALDIVGAFFCGVVALCLFGMHVVTHPKRFHWMTLPEYLRRGILATGVLFLLRSVELANLSSQVSIVSGHINPVGLMALLTLTYMTLALTYWLVTKVLPKHAWQRVSHVEAEERRSGGMLVPLMMPQDDVVDVARGLGFRATHAKAGPEELTGRSPFAD